MAPGIKICGLTRAVEVEAALAAGADYLGFVFYPPSPRNISPERAGELAKLVGAAAKKVALTVDADDGLLDAIMQGLAPDLFQLHGRETAARVREIRARYARPVIKAVHVGAAADVAAGKAYIDVADMLLYDARAPERADALPGGNGIAFDWALLAGAARGVPIMLSGGLTPDNVADAIRQVRPDVVDVSSGVEIRPGEKSPERIARFAEQVRLAEK